MGSLTATIRRSMEKIFKGLWNGDAMHINQIVSMGILGKNRENS